MSNSYQFIGSTAFLYQQIRYGQNFLINANETIVLTETPFIIKSETWTRNKFSLHLNIKGFNQKGEIVKLGIANDDFDVLYTQYDYFFNKRLYKFYKNTGIYLPVVNIKKSVINLPPFIFSKRLKEWGKITAANETGFVWSTTYMGKTQTFNVSAYDGILNDYFFSPAPLEVILNELPAEI